MATQEALTKDDLTHMHQGSGQSIGGTKMMQGEGEPEPHKHARQGRNRELGQDKEQSMAKGKHPGMGDRPDLHGDTGEGIAAQNLGGEQWQKEGKGSAVLGGGRPEVNY